MAMPDRPRVHKFMSLESPSLIEHIRTVLMSCVFWKVLPGSRLWFRRWQHVLETAIDKIGNDQVTTFTGKGERKEIICMLEAHCIRLTMVVASAVEYALKQKEAREMREYLNLPDTENEKRAFTKLFGFGPVVEYARQAAEQAEPPPMEKKDGEKAEDPVEKKLAEEVDAARRAAEEVTRELGKQLQQEVVAPAQRLLRVDKELPPSLQHSSTVPLATHVSLTHRSRPSAQMRQEERPPEADVDLVKGSRSNHTLRMVSQHSRDHLVHGMDLLSVDRQKPLDEKSLEA